MATPLTVLQRAKQGEPDAIAQLMNRTLNQRAAHVKVNRCGSEYRFLVESDQVPNKQATVKWIQQGLDKLAIPTMQTAIIYGKSRHSNKFNWQHNLPINVNANGSSSAQLQDLDNLVSPSQRVAQIVLLFTKLPDTEQKALIAHIDPLVSNNIAVSPQPTLESASKAWLAEALALDNTYLPLLFLWLGRYSEHPTKAVQCLHKILGNAAQNSSVTTDSATMAALGAVVEMSLAGKGTVVLPTTPRHRLQPTEKVLSSKDSWMPVWVLPSVWAMCLMITIIFSIESANAIGRYPIVCLDTAHPELCGLAAQITDNEKLLVKVIKRAVPVTRQIQATVVENCEKYSHGVAKASKATAYLPKTSRKSDILLDSETTEISRGVLLTDVTQIDIKTANQLVRVACVDYVVDYDAEGKGLPPRKIAYPRRIASSEIPITWPQEPFSLSPTKKAVKVYNTFVVFGSSTLFTAIGIFVAIMFCPCYTCYTLKGVYQIASMLGATEAVATMFMLLPGEPILPTMPFFSTAGLGALLFVPMTVVAIGLSSCFVKDFNIDWANGHNSIFKGAMIIIGIRFLLSSTLYGVIAQFIA